MFIYTAGRERRFGLTVVLSRCSACKDLRCVRVILYLYVYMYRCLYVWAFIYLSIYLSMSIY